MIKRVRLDANGALTEIDWKAAERAARALLDYIEQAPAEVRARFDYDAKALPFIEGVLARTIAVPFPYAAAPFNARSQREAWEPTPPEEFSELYARLLSRITGSPASSSLSTHESGRYVPGQYRELEADGTIYELCWFED